MNGEICIRNFDSFLKEVNENTFDFDKFNNIFIQTIHYLNDFPNDKQNRAILIGSLVSTIFLHNASIPEEKHLGLWEKLKKTFNSDEREDPDLLDLIEQVIQSP